MLAFTADNHIGITTQWSIKERGEDFMRSFHDMVESLLKLEGCTALVIGGDLFNTPFPGSFAVEFVQREVRRLTAAGMGVYGIDGNHDIANGKWLRVCGIEPLTEDPVQADGLNICGLGYRRPGEIMETLGRMADAGVKCDVLVLHLALGELNRMGAASDVTAAEMAPLLKAMGVKAVLIGHIHIRQSVVIDGITFAYCGSTEMCSMNEQKDKSFDVIDVRDGCSMRHVGIKTRDIEHVVIGTEEEYARFESSLEENSQVLYSLFIAPGIADGVARLRALIKSKNAMARVQTLHTDDMIPEKQASRSAAGAAGLEQAIAASFKPDSIEAELIRVIFSAPETLKVTVDNFMKADGMKLTPDSERIEDNDNQTT